MIGELLVAAGLMLALDQLTKRLVLSRFGRQCSRSRIGLRPRIRLLMNGRVIGLRLIRDPRGLVFLWCFAVLGTFLLTLHVPSFQTGSARLGVGAALGGATSNLLDQLWRGCVVDFIDLRIWPVFNLADAFIVLGAGVALCSIH